MWNFRQVAACGRGHAQCKDPQAPIPQLVDPGAPGRNAADRSRSTNKGNMRNRPASEKPHASTTALHSGLSTPRAGTSPPARPQRRADPGPWAYAAPRRISSSTQPPRRRGARMLTAYRKGARRQGGDPPDCGGGGPRAGGPDGGGNRRPRSDAPRSPRARLRTNRRSSGLADAGSAGRGSWSRALPPSGIPARSSIFPVSAILAFHGAGEGAGLRYRPRIRASYPAAATAVPAAALRSRSEPRFAMPPVPSTPAAATRRGRPAFRRLQASRGP